MGKTLEDYFGGTLAKIGHHPDDVRPLRAVFFAGAEALRVALDVSRIEGRDPVATCRALESEIKENMRALWPGYAGAVDSVRLRN